MFFLSRRWWVVKSVCQRCGATYDSKTLDFDKEKSYSFIDGTLVKVSWSCFRCGNIHSWYRLPYDEELKQNNKNIVKKKIDFDFNDNGGDSS